MMTLLAIETVSYEEYYKQLWNTRIILVILWIVTIVGGILLLSSHMKQRKDYNRIEKMLAKFLESGEIIESDSLETRESKIISQVRQILKMTEGRRKETETEKDGVTRLISDLSHQLKTPLANIQVYTELLKEDNLNDAERAEFMERIHAQAEKMEWLMKALLKTSRLETGIIQFEPENAYIRETIKESMEAVKGQAKQKNICIILEEFKDTLLVHNPKWTAEALTNILENAIKYSLEGTKIQISFNLMEIYGKISIQDEGIGIPKEEYTKVFNRFYRGKQVAEKQGTGLGLYLSRLILSKESGYITVDSTVGKGSCFSVFLLRK